MTSAFNPFNKTFVKRVTGSRTEAKETTSARIAQQTAEFLAKGNQITVCEGFSSVALKRTIKAYPEPHEQPDWYMQVEGFDNYLVSLHGYIWSKKKKEFLKPYWNTIELVKNNRRHRVYPDQLAEKHFGKCEAWEG